MTSIVVPVRRFASGANVSRYPVALKRTNLLDPNDCRAAVRGARYVFHLAYGASGSDAERATVEGTRNILQACRDEGVESVVVFGTNTVWAGMEEGILNESSPLAPALGEYGRSKAQMQVETLRFAAASSGMRVSIVSPGAVYGPGGGLFCATPCETARRGSFAWFGGGTGIGNYVYVDNLVDAAVLAAQSPLGHGECFIVVDGHATWREFLHPFVAPYQDSIRDLSVADVEALRRKPAKSASTKDLVRAVLASPNLMSAVSRHPVLGWAKDSFVKGFPGKHRRIQGMRSTSDPISKPPVQAPEPALWMADIFGPSQARFSSDKVRRVLAWSPGVDLAAGQQRCVSWLEEIRLLPEGSTAG